jgi:hypothetical protein
MLSSTAPTSNGDRPTISPLVPPPTSSAALEEITMIPAISSTTGSSSSIPAGGAYILEVRWCWKETDVRMSLHPSITIVGDKLDCMIAYPKNINDSIEAAFQAQKGTGQFSPTPNYVIHFDDTMKQTNIRTGYQRDVQRVVDTEAIAMPVPPTVVEENVTATTAGTKDAPLVGANNFSSSLLLAGNNIIGNSHAHGKQHDHVVKNFNIDAPSPFAAPPTQKARPSNVSQQVYGGHRPIPSSTTTTIPTNSNYYHSNFVDHAPSRKTPSSTSTYKVNIRWCWKETPVRVPNHPASSIVGDRSKCWIAYDHQANKKLEEAFNYQRGRKGNKCQPQVGYTVDFDSMIQTNTLTGYERDVQRVVEQDSTGKSRHFRL